MNHMCEMPSGYSLTLVLAAATGDGICCTHLNKTWGSEEQFLLVQGSKLIEQEKKRFP